MWPELTGMLENIPDLTGDHWKLTYCLRDYYERFCIAPMIGKLCTDTRLSPQKIARLFPPGHAKLLGLRA
jgi:tRNA 2-thiouridine synthesizing protein E